VRRRGRCRRAGSAWSGALCLGCPAGLAGPPDLPSPFAVTLHFAYPVPGQIFNQQIHPVPPKKGHAGCPPWKKVVVIGVSLIASLQGGTVRSVSDHDAQPP